MWDLISEKRVLLLHPKVRAKARAFIDAAEKQGIKLRVTASLRTYAEQDKLYAQGRTTAGAIVTNAKSGSSYHNFGLALDVVPIMNGKAVWDADWKAIGAIGKAVGFAWGGDWRKIVDKPHFEMTFGYSVAKLRGLQIVDGYVLIA